MLGYEGQPNKKGKKMNKISIYAHDSNTIIPNHINEKHWDEWANSGVKYSIISLNVCSVDDPLKVDKLLNRNNKARWKHSTDLVPCWAVSGVDPQTGETTLLGCQVKPDTPILNQRGKIQKYLCANEYSPAPLFLDTGIHNFWKSVIDEKSEPIILTEGAKKAGAGLSIGYTTISIPGVSTCRKNGRLHDSLDLFAGFGRTFYLCFDNDSINKKPVQDALLSMARELSATGSKVMVIVLPPGEMKGMDDFISHHGEEEFKKLFDSALTIEEWRKKLEKQWQDQPQEEEPKSKLKRFFEIVRDGWGEGLRLNKLKNVIELGSDLLDINKIRLQVALEFCQDVPIGDSQAIVELLAEQNAYNPILEYLDQVAMEYPNIDTSILDNLATRYFGSDNELHNIYMKKTLVAAVARARKPGCKHDCATILVGKQGTLKSTFWKHLFGEDWFTDELGEASEKDELMKLHRFWGLEWSEFETVYRRKDVSALKKFMSSTIDAFRTPYSRTVKEYRRSCVLVGTTNETEILADPTGSRRFWVIPVTSEISLKLLCEERNKLWAAANALYQMGETWWLSAEQAERQEMLNQEFRVKDPWETAVKLYLQPRDCVTTEELLAHVGVEQSRQDVAAAKRISAILRSCHWRPGRKRINGEPMRVWIPENSPSQKNVENQVERPLEHSQQALQPTKNLGDPLDPLELPKLFSNLDSINFEVGAVYWSESVQKRVKIVKLFKTIPEADVCVSGEIEIVRVKLSDLTLVSSSPSPSPQANALAVGDRVTPLEGKHKKDVFTITAIDNAGIWVKKMSRGFAPPVGPFQQHQLKKHIGGE